jgi:hypothetical protein
MFPSEDKTAPKPAAQAAFNKGRDFLRSVGNNGAWSYYRQSDATSIEATSWCALALRDDAGVRRQSIDYLMNVQNSDGGWTTEPTFGASDWNSALALLSLRVLSDAEHSDKNAENSKFRGGLQFLLDHKTEFWTGWATIVVAILKGSDFLKYPQGWPWTMNTFHWVEPTSYALLAIKPLATDQMKESITRANTFLLERHCKDGGWNHGDFKSFAVYAGAYPVTTAQALCALQDLPNEPVVKGGLDFLNKIEAEQNTVMAIAWSILARDLYGLNVAQSRMKLAQMQRPDGSFHDNNLLNALAVCALDEKSNALRFPTAHEASPS